MSGTIAGNAPGQNFAAFRYIAPQLVDVFVIDTGDFVDTKAAYALAFSSPILAHLQTSYLKWYIVVVGNIGAVLL
jgi:hypothetical protein